MKHILVLILEREMSTNPQESKQNFFTDSFDSANWGLQGDTNSRPGLKIRENRPVTPTAYNQYRKTLGVIAIHKKYQLKLRKTK